MPYVITPLPVQDFAVELLLTVCFTVATIRIDSLETTANAENTLLFIRINDEGFNVALFCPPMQSNFHHSRDNLQL